MVTCGSIHLVALGPQAHAGEGQETKPTKKPKAPTAGDRAGGQASDQAVALPAGLSADASEDQRDSWLASRVAALIDERPVLAQSHIAIAVREIGQGRERVVYQRDPERLSHVASNVKILTASAALASLGPDFRYRTSALAGAVDAQGVITGDLYLRGSGDPRMDVEDLDYLAKELVLAGITGVQGRLLIDDSYFDGLITPPHFDDFSDPVDRHARYRAPIAALTVEQGTFEVVIAPARSGSGPARVAIDPPSDYVRVTDNGMLTQSSGRRRLDASAKVVDGRMSVVVRGQIRAGAQPIRFRLRVEDPAIYAGAVMKELLRRRGVEVRGAVERGRAPADLEILASAASPPLSVMVRHLGKRSNNAVAEALLLTLGAERIAAPEKRPATWDDGLSAMRAFAIGELGFPDADDGFLIANGSGLFGPTRLSPALLVASLGHALGDARYGPDFIASLAIAGIDGTLRRRMTRTRARGLVRGKTGTLGSVSALSGYASIPGSPTLVFSIVASDLPSSGAAKRKARRAARRLQDRIADALIAHLQAGSTAPAESTGRDASEKP